jgi:hypothetical protein
MILRILQLNISQKPLITGISTGRAGQVDEVLFKARIA